ncbi:MAG: hypothetical protein ACI4SF_14535 [Oscillospiraceae bacterium]
MICRIFISIQSKIIVTAFVGHDYFVDMGSVDVIDENEMPLGFGMALAQNTAAMKIFSELPDSEQHRLIDGTHRIRSKSEMHRYVSSIAEFDRRSK